MTIDLKNIQHLQQIICKEKQYWLKQSNNLWNQKIKIIFATSKQQTNISFNYISGRDADMWVYEE